MPPNDKPNGTDMVEPGGVWNGHESRIQRVESAIGIANVSLERVETNLENVTRTVTHGFEDLGRKMDVAVAQNDSIEAKVDNLVPRIESLEKEQGRRKDRKMKIRATVGGLGLVGMGAIVSKWGEGLAHFISTLFR